MSIALAPSRRLTTSTIALAIGATALWASAPASAASNGFIAAPNGMVGVTETITVKAPGATGQTVTLGLVLGATQQTLQTVIGANGFGSIQWTPQAAGTWTINGLGTALSAGSATFTVAPMPTYTVLLAQGQATAGINNNLAAAVIAPIGTLAPSGSVYLATANGNGITTQPIGGSFGNSTSTVVLPWTPTANGDTPLVATYQPASGGQLASTSQISQPNVSTAIAPVAVRWPATLYVGRPTVLQAVLGHGYPDGSVAFSINGTPLSGSIATANGVASFPWTPTSSGVQYISVAYTSNTLPNGTAYSGTAGPQAVNIQPGLPQDNITVDPPSQPAWSIAKPIVMQAGSTVTLAASSTSGTTVLFSEQGPCVINANVLTALSAGQCQVTAQTPGTATITPGTENYTITVTAPAKKKSS